MDTATGNPFIAAAKRMKSKTGWFENGNGTNYSRLNCKPGGVRLNDGSFTGYGRQIGYWSILPESIDTPTSTHAYRTPYYLVEFHAIRSYCVRRSRDEWILCKMHSAIVIFQSKHLFDYL